MFSAYVFPTSIIPLTASITRPGHPTARPSGHPIYKSRHPEYKYNHPKYKSSHRRASQDRADSGARAQTNHVIW